MLGMSYPVFSRAPLVGTWQSGYGLLMPRPYEPLEVWNQRCSWGRDMFFEILVKTKKSCLEFKVCCGKRREQFTIKTTNCLKHVRGAISSIFKSTFGSKLPKAHKAEHQQSISRLPIKGALKNTGYGTPNMFQVQKFLKKC